MEEAEQLISENTNESVAEILAISNNSAKIQKNGINFTEE
jgi:DNA-binding CsgD family transcriptional regulator